MRLAIPTQVPAWMLCLYLASAPEATASPRLDNGIAELLRDHPTTVQLFELGKNTQGASIPALRVSLQSQGINKSDSFLIVGGHHGDEPHSVWFALHFAKSLAQQMESGSAFRNRLWNTQWTIVPALNLPGLRQSQRQENGLDPNRDYPGPCNPNHQPKLESVQALMRHLDSTEYGSIATVHGYIGTLTYPWGTPTANPLNLDHRTYEKAVRQSARWNGYRYGTSSQVIYPATGTFEDFAHWRHGAWSLLVELETGLARDLIQTTESLLNFFRLTRALPAVRTNHSGGCDRSVPLDLFLE